MLGEGEDWVCGIAARSVLEGGFCRSRGGNMGESDSGSGLNFVLAPRGRREKSTSEDAGLRGRRLKGALPMYASLVLCFLVFTCRLCMSPHTRGPVIYPLSIKH